jgi:putative ABC transport system permease protein
MLLSNLKIGIRMIARQKIYAIINLIGLAVGLTTCLFLTLYIIDEFRYDSFHRDADRIYRVNLYGRLASQEFNTCYTASPIAPGMKSEFPEIEDACRIALWDDIPVRYDEISFSEKKILVADSNYFNFFSFKLLQGDINTVLKEPNGVVLTESMASRLLGYKGAGDNTPLGKPILIGTDKRVFKVAGITEDPPHNSHFHYSLILPMESWDASHSQVWLNSNLNTYLKLGSKVPWEGLQSKFPDLVKKYVGPQVQAAMGISMEDFFSKGGAYGYTLQPMLNIHLKSELDRDLEPGGNMSTIYILITIVIFVLAIACINFMNLATARFSVRAREVGVRKTMGASKMTLIYQFLGESFLMTFLSFLIALILIAILISRFNMLAGKDLNLNTFIQYQYIIGILAFILVIGLLAGSYPAFYLSSFKPVEVLKGRIKSGRSSGLIRRVLVVFQFFTSTILIISTIVIFKQLKHLDKKDLGFSKENILVIKNANALGSNKLSFRDEIKSMTIVKGASIVNIAPPEVEHSDVFMPVKEDGKDVGFNYCTSDENFKNALGITMVSGRFFSSDFPSDSNAVIINEAAAKLIGWKDATGERIKTHWDYMKEPQTIIGVVKDFNFQTLKKKITPLAIFPGTEGENLLVRIGSDDIVGAVAQIESRWKTFTDDAVFRYSFISEDFQAKFRNEKQFATVVMVFTFLAIFIACLGLFGLSTFTAEQRRKEMGVRKVLGASFSLLMKALSADFFRLIIIAFVLATPVTWILINWWLNGFAYHIGIDAVTFIAGGLIIILVAALSLFYQSVKITHEDPVKALQYE